MTYSTPQLLLRCVLVEGKKAGLEDPWAGVKDTNHPLICTMCGRPGRSGAQIDRNATMGRVRPLVREDPYAAFFTLKRQAVYLIYSTY